MPVLNTLTDTDRSPGHLKLLPYTLPAREAAVARAPGWSSYRALFDLEGARRALNVAVALLALVLLSPVMLLIAVAIKLTSPGGVIYRQTRVGIDRRSPNLPAGNWRRGRDLGGKPFTIYKFRTMYESEGEAERWATPDDPRVTPIGRFLRLYRLDELPQLVNVLRGDMNIVGPRPEQPHLFADLRERVSGYHLRQRVLPGITGWSQVNQSYDTCLDDVRHKVRYDLEYIRNASVVEDLKIMARTMPVMIGRKGAW
jgi:lipopolysaccharide/colanic/teichoic acid biosynthesis glycosyltransferase